MGTPDSAALGLDGLRDASNALGFDIYGVAREGRGNVALSPVSLAAALAMTWAGARGETAIQMGRVLHLRGATGEILEGESRALAWFRAPAESRTLRMANGLFGDERLVFDAAYVATATRVFGATVQQLDFAGAPEKARRRINDWVSRETDGQIEAVIPPGGVSSSSRVVLADAVYLRASWAHPFEASATKPAPFYTSPSTMREVPMMHEREWLLFARAGDVTLLEIPYSSSALAMMLVVPDAIDGLAGVEASLTPGLLSGWTHALARREVEVSMPKFDTGSTGALSLRPILTSLGMSLAFDPRRADFTGLARSSPPGDGLFLGDVFHSAVVKVDERGTVASATTTSLLARPMLRMREPPPAVFTADRPFLFFLRDTVSGAVLFMGRVLDPVAER